MSLYSALCLFGYVVVAGSVVFASDFAVITSIDVQTVDTGTTPIKIMTQLYLSKGRAR